MNTKEYNGWHNYETWLIKLWIDNDAGSEAYWRETAEEHFKTYGEDAARSLADRLKEEHEEHANEAVGDNGWLCDLIGAALSEVDWYEIAESLLTDHCEDYGKETATA